MFAPIQLRAAEPSALVIGEISWSGSTFSTSDEWIELWNLSEQTQSLSGWILKGAANNRDIRFDTEDFVPPHSVFLIANYRANDEKSILAVMPNLVTTTLAIQNDHLQIELMDYDGNVMDRAGDGKEPMAGSSGSEKKSMVRADPASDGTLTISWKDASDRQNFRPDTPDQGTPGICDGCSRPMVTESVETTPPTMASATTTSVASSTETEIAVPETFASVPASSTEPIIEPVASSTDAMPGVLSTSTSTDVLMPPHSSEEIPSSVMLPITEEATAATALPLIPPDPEPQTPLIVRINEISSVPSDGSEWIELASEKDIPLSQLDGWTLEDEKNTVYKFDHANHAESHELKRLFLIRLTSSRLNNDGDAVKLKNADGQLVHQVTFGALSKGQSWMRFPEQAPNWRITTTPTPEEDNIFTEPPTPVSLQPVARTNLQIPPLIETARIPMIAEKSTESKPPIIPMASSTIRAAAFPIVSSPSRSSSTSTKKTVMKTERKNKQPQTEKRSRARKAAPHPIRNLSIPMITQTESGLRASLSGIVATIPGLLGSHQFVLHTEDGRGLLIRGNGKQPSPPFRSVIRISGTLITNDNGTTLNMYAQDRWTLLREEADTASRPVDFLAPSWEDAWSLVHVTATVLETRTNHATIDADGIPLILQIRPAVRFRTERLRSGDVVRIRGILDTRADELKIIPRSADEIVILKHAALNKVSGQSAGDPLHPWTPLGAAGITVALAQGYKKIKKIHEQKRVDRLLKQAMSE